MKMVRGLLSDLKTLAYGKKERGRSSIEKGRGRSEHAGGS